MIKALKMILHKKPKENICLFKNASIQAYTTKYCF